MDPWVNLIAYENNDDDGLEVEDLSEDDSEDDSELSDNDSLPFIVPSGGPDSDIEGPETHNAPSTVRLLLGEEEQVRQHGVHSSVQHFQCCDAISLAGADSDHLVFAEGKFAAIYSMEQQALVTAVNLGFQPYSIACHEDLFAAVGTRDVKIFYLRPDSKKGNAVTFQLAAHFRVGSMGASNMNNGVRFGRCGAEWKLLVAGQDHHVYVFSVPKSDERSRGAPAGSCPYEQHPAARDFLSSSLSKQPRRSVRRPMEAARGEPPEVRGAHGEELATDVIGPFDVPLNCVVASPEGNLLAVVGDSPCVWLLDHASGYSTSNMACFSLDSRNRRPSYRGYRGCQYAAWNSTSDLLAVSSDTDYLVRVWRVKPPAGRQRPTTRSSPGDPPTAEAVATFHHNFPCLALQFSPVDPLLLFYTEVPDLSSHRVYGVGALHVADLRRPLDATQTLKVNRYPDECAAAQFLWGGCSERHATPLECIKAGCLGYRKWQKPNYTPPSRKGGATSGTCLHRITGLAVSRKHGVLLALNGGGDNGVKNRVLQFRPLRWSLDTHRLFPEQFQNMARFVLLAAGEQADRTAEGALRSSFSSLPRDLVYSIIERAAEPQSAWVPCQSQPDQDEIGKMEAQDTVYRLVPNLH